MRMTALESKRLNKGPKPPRIKGEKDLDHSTHKIKIHVPNVAEFFCHKNADDKSVVHQFLWLFYVLISVIISLRLKYLQQVIILTAFSKSLIFRKAEYFPLMVNSETVFKQMELCGGREKVN